MFVRPLSSALLMCAVLLGSLAPAALADPTPRISIFAASVAEGDSDLVDLAFSVTLSRATTERVTVDYVTTGGSALGAPPFPEASDFVPTSDTLTIEPGDTLAFAHVKVRGDRFHEANENFFVNLSNATHADIDVGQAEGLIVNDDPLPEISISDAMTLEGGKARFTLTLSRPSLDNVGVDIATRDGTAHAAEGDYVSLSRRVVFLSGITRGTFDIETARDGDSAPAETFLVDLKNPSGATLGDALGLGLIVGHVLP
jgi:Calx-beta domain